MLESPRWLLVRNRPNDAHKVFEKVAEWNSKPAPRLEEIQELQNYMLKQESSGLTGLKAMKTIMQNSDLRKNLAIETFCVVTCVIVGYGISFNTKNLGGNKYLNVFYMGILDFFAPPASIIFAKNLGRRKTFMLYMFGGAIFMIAVVFLLLLNPGVWTPTIAMILSQCGRFCIVAAGFALKVMVMETSPTNLRATCAGLTAFSGYFGGIFAPQLVALGIRNF